MMKLKVTINLDECVEGISTIMIEIVSQFTKNMNTVRLIYEYYIDNKILIPNVSNADEFIKYWFLVQNSGMINRFRDYHPVDLYPNHLQLIRRGSITLHLQAYIVSYLNIWI